MFTGTNAATVATVPSSSAPSARNHLTRGPLGLTLLRAVAIAAWIAIGLVLLRPTVLGGTTGYIIVSGTSMEPTFHTGDLVITRRQSHYSRGDIVALRVPEGHPAAGATVIHRIVRGSPAKGYVTQGDNREFTDSWHPKATDIIGTARTLVPLAGDALGYLKGATGLATIGALMALAFLWPKRPADDRDAARAARHNAL